MSNINQEKVQEKHGLFFLPRTIFEDVPAEEVIHHLTEEQLKRVENCRTKKGWTQKDIDDEIRCLADETVHSLIPEV